MFYIPTRFVFASSFASINAEDEIAASDLKSAKQIMSEFLFIDVGSVENIDRNFIND